MVAELQVVQSVIVGKPDFNITQLVDAGRKAVDRRISERVDATKRDVGNVESFVSCLANLRDGDAKVGFPNEFLNHAQYTLLFAGSEWVLLLFRDYCDNMITTTIDTPHDGVILMVMTGGVAEWIRAWRNIKSHDEPALEEGAANMKNQFVKAKLGHLFK